MEMVSSNDHDGLSQPPREWWVPLAAVAAVAVAASLAAALLLGERGAPQGSAPAPLASRLGLAARAALVALGSDEQEFEAARAELLRALEARRDRLPEASRNAVTESLVIIEGEIAAISEELSRDPENPRLARLLAEAYRRELELLQLAAGLPGGEPAPEQPS
jgi:hypothetical protein